MLQNLWLLKQDWDESVLDNIAKAWIAFKNQLPDVETIKIPRWTGTFENSTCACTIFGDA